MDIEYLDNTGQYKKMQLDIEYKSLGGACPLQAEGTVNGAEFYFRARHNEWWFMMDGEVLFHAPWGARDFAAGYMPEEEAENIIGGCCRAWAIEQDRAGE